MNSRNRFTARVSHARAVILLLLMATSTLPVAGGVASASGSSGTVVALRSTSAYGSVLVVGKGPLIGFPIYEFSGDANGTFGCGTKLASGYDLGPSVSVPL